VSNAKRQAPVTPPSPELILAAVERAVRHRGQGRAAAPRWAILAHLAIPRRSGAARALARQLDALCSEGALVSSRAHGVDLLALSPAGRALLLERRHEGASLELAESPQHAAWRNARTAASQEIERFRRRLGASVEAATLLLAAAAQVDSDTWFELGERLQRNCWLLASATHCSYEWPEPDDALPDIDSYAEAPGSHPARRDPAALARRRARRAGRRNISLWRDQPESGSADA
jgi:hypothetical protein